MEFQYIYNILIIPYDNYRFPLKFFLPGGNLQKVLKNGKRSYEETEHRSKGSR